MTDPAPPEHLRFSQRPGFTMIGGVPSGVGPVVVRLDGSRESFHALRAAADQAMTRSAGLIVIDETGLGRSDPAAAFTGIEGREQTVAIGILHNNHVAILETTEDDQSVEFYLGLGTSLLVIHADDAAGLADQPELMAALLEAPFDLMLLTAGDTQEFQISSSTTNVSGSIVRSQAL